MDSILNEWDAELETIRNLTPKEADAAIAEAYRREVVTCQEADDAVSEVEKAVSHLRAICEKMEKNSTTAELEKMSSLQILEEAEKEVTAKLDAAIRMLDAAKRTKVKSQRFVEAISKAQGKRPMTDCQGRGDSSCSNWRVWWTWQSFCFVFILLSVMWMWLHF